MYRYKIKNINKVIDGDTIDIDIDLGFSITISSRIRLKGINAPETRTTDLDEKEKGIQAKNWLIEKLSTNEEFIIDTYKEDKYGRMLGILYSENSEISINQMMLNEGIVKKYL